MVKVSIDEKLFRVQLVKEGELLEKAQLLRGEVFFGSRKRDEDRFDEFCDHLVVIDRDTGNVVGTYRLLLGSAARNKTGFYSETEFDLKNIKSLDGAEFLEMGRACVNQSYRKYPIIGLMWKAILSYVEANKAGFIFGCASIDEPSPGKVGKIFGYLKERHYSLPEFRVYPLGGRRYPYIKDAGAASRREAMAELPSLIRGYLNIGAFVCGEPAWDKTFETADFFMMIDTKDINTSYLRKLL